MKKVSIVVIILLLSAIIGVGAIIERQTIYHETDFSNDNWFDLTQNLVINTTTNNMYLEGILIENNNVIDCTTYTKVGTHTTVTTSQIRHQYDSLNDDDWVYKDFTAGYWTSQKNLEINYTILNSDNNPYRWSCVLALSNSLNAWGDDNGRNIVVISHWGNVEYNMYLAVGERDLGSWTNWDGNGVTTNLVRDTDYYCTFYLNSTYVVNDVYSDLGRTTRIRHLYMLLDDSNYVYRYLYLTRSYSGGTGGDGSICDTYGKNYKIRYYTSGIETTGYAYTKNLLENETDIGYMVMSNHTIGKGGGLKIYVSANNSTWTKIIDTTVTAKQYNRIEILNYTDLYCKLELTSNGINNVYVNRFGYSNIGEITEINYVEPPPAAIELSNIIIPIVIIALVIVIIAIIKK